MHALERCIRAVARKDPDIKAIKDRLQDIRSDIDNLTHNLQGFVDPNTEKDDFYSKSHSAADDDHRAEIEAIMAQEFEVMEAEKDVLKSQLKEQQREMAMQQHQLQNVAAPQMQVPEYQSDPMVTASVSGLAPSAAFPAVALATTEASTPVDLPPEVPNVADLPIVEIEADFPADSATSAIEPAAEASTLPSETSSTNAPATQTPSVSPSAAIALQGETIVAATSSLPENATLSPPEVEATQEHTVEETASSESNAVAGIQEMTESVVGPGLKTNETADSEVGISTKTEAATPGTEVQPPAAAPRENAPGLDATAALAKIGDQSSFGSPHPSGGSDQGNGCDEAAETIAPMKSPKKFGAKKGKWGKLKARSNSVMVTKAFSPAKIRWRKAIKGVIMMNRRNKGMMGMISSRVPKGQSLADRMQRLENHIFDLRKEIESAGVLDLTTSLKSDMDGVKGAQEEMMQLLQKLGVTDDGVLSKLVAMDAASKLQELEKLLVGAEFTLCPTLSWFI